MNKLRVGIDIGASGAIAFFNEDELISYHKMPKDGDEIDVDMLVTYIREHKPTVNGHCVIEDLHSIFGASASSNFQFGVNNGLVTGMLKTLKIPFTKVAPKTWQKVMWQGIRPVEINTGKVDKKGNPKYKIDTKATSLIAAKRLFPTHTFLASERSKVPHNGIVDSVLIGEYCRRTF